MIAPTALVLLGLALPTVFVAQEIDCAQDAVRNVSTTRNNDEFTRVKWEGRSCKGSIEIRGKAGIAGDLSGFTSISSGGRVSIATEGRGGERKLVLTPSNDRFAYQYEVDGRRRAWDEDGQRWLGSVVAILVRRAGFGAAERVEYLLKERGVGGVLEEVRALESDYTQRRYLDLMLERTTLNGGAVRSVLELAARELKSDYELAQLLLSVGKRYRLTDESRAAYIAATASLASDYERSRALTAVLASRELSAADAAAVLQSAAEMSSDYERGRVLKQAARVADLADARVQRAYLEVSSAMRSDHERRQSLAALLDRGRQAEGAVDVVLTAAAAFRSDYEQAELLTLLLRTQTLTRAQKAQLVKLIEEIDSDHERGRVAAEMLKRVDVN